MAASETYKAVSNYIENELGFSKSEVDHTLNTIIERAVDKRVKEFLDSHRFERMVYSMIGSAFAINSSRNYNLPTLTDESKKEIKKMASDMVRDMVHKSIKFQSIDVTVVNEVNENQNPG